MAPFRIERFSVKSFLDAMKGFLDKVTFVVGCFAGLLIFCCGMMIAYEVVCRSAFNAPTEWVMELATYCVTVAGFLGMSVTYAAKKHIHVDLLLTKLSQSTCDKLEIVTTLVGAFYSFIFMVKGAQMVMLSDELNNCAPTTLQTPLWIPQSSMPIGMGILFLYLVHDFLEKVYVTFCGKEVNE